MEVRVLVEAIEAEEFHAISAGRGLTEDVQRDAAIVDLLDLPVEAFVRLMRRGDGVVEQPVLDPDRDRSRLELLALRLDGRDRHDVVLRDAAIELVHDWLPASRRRRDDASESVHSISSPGPCDEV